MVEVWLPYGDTEVCLTVPVENYVATLNPKPTSPPPDMVEELKNALERPFGNRKLREDVKPGSKVVIVIDENAETTPLQPLVSQLLGELSRGGVKNSDVTIILGYGVDKPFKPEERRKLLGNIADEVEVKVHDPEKLEDLVEVGVTSSRMRALLNRAFVEADVRVSVGKIGLHPYAGYSGGRQTVAMGITATRTIRQNYSLAADQNSRVGNLERNPVHLNMTEIAKLSRLDFILNVVTNENNELLRAFSGNVDAAFSEGVTYFEAVYGVPVEAKADVVVVSPGGYPFDADLYEAQESLARAMGIVKDGGVVIWAAQCSEGYGKPEFYRWLSELRTVEEAKDMMKKNPVHGIHKVFQLLNCREKVQVIAVSALPETLVTGVLRFKTAKCVDEAVDMAFRLAGRKAKFLVLPQAMKTLPVLKPATPQL